MTERALGSGLRVLLGVIGAAAVGAGCVVGATELRYAYLDSPLVPALVAAVVAGVVVVGGVLLGVSITIEGTAGSTILPELELFQPTIAVH